MKYNSFIIMYEEGVCENCNQIASECAKNKCCKIYEKGKEFDAYINSYKEMEDNNGKKTF